MTAAAVLAVDGGNSKADVVLVGTDGAVLGFTRGATVSHQQIGLSGGMDRLVRIAAGLARQVGLSADRPVAEVGAYCLAGADFTPEFRKLERGLEATGLAVRTIVRNDAVGALRAGATGPTGVALICGQGVNGAAIGPGGRFARFDAVGVISGDWGGGRDLGDAALAAAVRAADGRGPATTLEGIVARHFGRRGIETVVKDLYYERIDEDRLGELSPRVFEAAGAGDAVARSIVDRLADELVAMARALIRRTGQSRTGPEVVLAGGVFRTREPGFYARLEAGVRRAAPDAHFVRLDVSPVLGAGLIGLEALGLGETALRAAESRLRRELASARAV